MFVYNVKDSLGYNQFGSDIKDTTPFFEYPLAISADGTIVAIGGRPELGDRRIVRVFQKDLSIQSYQQIGSEIKLISSPSSMAMSADGVTLAIGESEINNVRIYQKDTFNQTYRQIGSLSGESISDSFGYSLAMSADATIIAVGAIQ